MLVVPDRELPDWPPWPRPPRGWTKSGPSRIGSGNPPSSSASGTVATQSAPCAFVEDNPGDVHRPVTVGIRLDDRPQLRSCERPQQRPRIAGHSTGAVSSDRCIRRQGGGADDVTQQSRPTTTSGSRRAAVRRSAAAAARRGSSPLARNAATIPGERVAAASSRGRRRAERRDEGALAGRHDQPSPAPLSTHTQPKFSAARRHRPRGGGRRPSPPGHRAVGTASASCSARRSTMSARTDPGRRKHQRRQRQAPAPPRAAGAQPPWAPDTPPQAGPSASDPAFEANSAIGSAGRGKIFPSSSGQGGA